MEWSHDPYTQLAYLRTAVAYLGESSNYHWWDTNFLSPTGQQFLSINFPRTAFAAGFNSTVSAAKRLHDEHIGKGGVYHLFRLPSHIEERIHKLVLHAEGEDLEVFEECIQSKEAALDTLACFTVNIEGGSAEGPVQIGTFKNQLSNAERVELGEYYMCAFNDQKRCFPYFNVKAS